MTIKPLGGRVVLKLIPKEETTKSGIVLPTNGEKEKSKAEIIAVGPGKMLESGERAAMGVAVGQIVLVKSWGGEEVEMEGESYKIVEEDDILAVVE